MYGVYHKQRDHNAHRVLACEMEDVRSYKKSVKKQKPKKKKSQKGITKSS